MVGTELSMVGIEHQTDQSSPIEAATDRRLTSRFPVEQQIRYRLVQSKPAAKSSVGKTLNISSGGILFTTAERLLPGHVVEIAMHWPVRLNGTCPLQFVATGRVIRSDDTSAAVRIHRYEFRTRAANTMVARATGA